MSSTSTVTRLLKTLQVGMMPSGAARKLNDIVGIDVEDSLPKVASPGTTFAFSGDSSGRLAGALQKAFLQALLGQSKLPDQVRALHGMSGQSYRSLINNLIGGLDAPNYLEIGSWAGSTAASAIFGNKLRCVCIDNWSQFGGPKADFEAAIAQVTTKDVQFSFIESDFRTVDYAALGKFDVYLFDGPHSQLDHFDGVDLVQPCLADEYILIVDDWNWRSVRMGTLGALQRLGSEIVYQLEVLTSLDESPPPVIREKSEWHNGYTVAVVRKLKA